MRINRVLTQRETLILVYPSDCCELCGSRSAVLCVVEVLRSSLSRSPVIHRFASHFWSFPPLVFFSAYRTLLSFYANVLSSHVGYIWSDKDSPVLLPDWFVGNDGRPNSGFQWLLWSAQAPRFWTCQEPAVSHCALAPPIFPTLSAKRHRLLLLSTRLKGKMFRSEGVELLESFAYDWGKTEKYITDGEKNRTPSNLVICILL